ncbi:MAG: cryptochrome/photolyase family protein [Candidatus Woesearchaeota archaeon]
MKHKALGLILGNCLFKDHKALGDDILYFMKEDYSLCEHFKYHKHKIILFLSAMRHHKETLKENISYHELSKESYEDTLKKVMEKNNLKKIVTYDIEDKFFDKRIRDFCKENDYELEIKDSPGFLTSKYIFKNWLDSQKGKPLMHNFYVMQRKRLGILLNDDESPKGGKWSFDDLNREKLPKGIELPRLKTPIHTSILKEVIKLVDKEFNDHPGDSKDFFLPVTRNDALLWLDDFFKVRFNNFGPYEDAISKDNSFLFHSVLSPLINLGLLTPKKVVDKALEQDVRLNSLEGFIRQIIGWREFVRGLYHFEDFNKNFFEHKRKLPKSFYDGTTGIEPLDVTIKKALRFGYLHHIERLMIMSNFMLLCEFDPKDVYTWFMELFVDSSDWVMVPNVYGMGQFSTDLFATKPYISGSNYVLKMSDFDKGEWCDVWDGLYWRFIDEKRDFFKSNPRMGMMVSMFDRMKKEKKNYILKKANSFLEGL